LDGVGESKRAKGRQKIGYKLSNATEATVSAGLQKWIPALSCLVTRASSSGIMQRQHQTRGGTVQRKREGQRATHLLCCCETPNMAGAKALAEATIKASSKRYFIVIMVVEIAEAAANECKTQAK